MKKGQTMIEYVIAMATIVLIAGVIGYVVAAAQRHTYRSVTLVSSEYP